MPARRSHRARSLSAVGLAALLALGVAARGRLYLAQTSYWYDEAYLLLNVFDRSFAGLVGPLGGDQAAPPLFLLLLRALYVAAGRAEWVMRLPAFAASLAALAVMVPLARATVGRRGTLLAAGLGAVCYHGVTHGSEVKPYALDLLASEVMLLAGAAVLTPAPGRRGRGPALLAAAVLAPWLSFPSVFALGAVSLALLTAACRGRSPRLWPFWCAFNLAALASCGALWWLAARHLSTPGLRQFWAGCFPDLSKPGRAAAWTLGYLVETADYGATGLGVPLLLLAAAGLAALARRSPESAVLLAAPPALAWVACAAGKYPLGDRLVFFAAPCVWLAAAAGGAALARRARGRAAAAAAALAAALLLPGAARMVKHLPRAEGKCDFRGAFAFVDARRRPGEALCVSHPEVYEVYHGRPPRPGGPVTPLALADRLPVAGGVWVVSTPQAPGLAQFPKAFEHLGAAAGPPRLLRTFPGVEVWFYGSAAR
jgi:hypothetical protein